MNEKTHKIAINLTTGLIPSNTSIHKVYKFLCVLLQKYQFKDYEFVLEFINNELLLTKVHYHGYIEVKVENIHNYNLFIDSWKSHIGMVKCNIISDLGKWREYIYKHIDITLSSYKNRFDIVQTIITRETLPKDKELIKFETWFKKKKLSKDRI